MRLTTTEKSYERNWSDYRRRRRWGYIMVITWIPLVLLSIYLTDRFPSAKSYFTAGILVYMGIFFLVGTWVGLWPCPRCGAPFFLTRWLYYRRSADKCVHCGLPKWALEEEVATPNNSLQRTADGARVGEGQSSQGATSGEAQQRKSWGGWYDG